MAITAYDIKKLFEVVFNYRMPTYPLLVGERPAIATGMKISAAIPFLDRSNSDYEINIPERREKSNLGQPFYDKNLLGMEMFMPITLIHKDKNNKETKLLLQNTVVSMKMKKTIVETPLVNRQGSVKEIISIDDWKIPIKGMIVSADNDYPDDAVKELKDFVEINEAIDIASVLTAIFLSKDEKVVIEDFELSEMKGIQHAQGFTMNLVSDVQFELILE